MEYQFKTAYYKPDKQGIFLGENSCRFAVEFENKNLSECGLILYDKNNKQTKIPASYQARRGSLCGFEITGEGLCDCTYQYYNGEDTFADPYARGIAGLEKWGDFSREERPVFGRIIEDTFDWEEDEPLRIPYNETILYGLNVRAFTMHKTSGVKHKGTFEGIIEKIPYLKELGITCIELMPAYEYEECMQLPTAAKTMQEASMKCTMDNTVQNKVNCWGFQKGFYFAPKASFAVQRPEISFKKMVKALHQNGMEVMMHFYFPPDVKPSYILDVLKYWVVEYHLDGIRISGMQIPYKMIAQEPVLKETKIRSEHFPITEIYGTKAPVYRNLLANNDNFKVDMRRFLKGDENLVNQVIFYQKHNPQAHAVLNAITDYDGLSLYDSVVYERKHNEANGEENRDGTDYNYTWNCGIEGESRKKAIVELRIRQIKNALTFLLLSQGVPYIFAGDEFGNTRMGNNNAYCQDNEIGFVKWKENQFSKEIYSFWKKLVAVRKAHPVLHLEKECRVMDAIGCGYPDISYHGAEAWRPDLSYISRMIGIMLCGKYAPEKEDDSFYIACNMHWEEHELALPKLPKGMKWVKALDTAGEDTSKDFIAIDNKVLAKGRSVSLYCSAKDENYHVKGRNSKNNKKDGK